MNAVIHTHSCYATAWSFLGEPLLPQIEEMDYFDIGPVDTVPPEPSGSARLGHSVANALRSARAVLLAGHGVVAVGESLATALNVARAVEHQAHVDWLLRSRADHQCACPRSVPGGVVTHPALRAEDWRDSGTAHPAYP